MGKLWENFLISERIKKNNNSLTSFELIHSQNFYEFI